MRGNDPEFDLMRALRVFVTVVDMGSFSAASDRLDLARGQPSRYLAKLEAHLGTRLMHRSTRRQSLTDAGTAFYQKAVQILQLVQEAEQDLALDTQRVSGRLRLSAPVSFGITHLAPALASFKKAHPEVSLDVTLDDRQVNLVEEGFDMAIRIAASLHPSLVSRPLMAIDLILCAAPAYLSASPELEQPMDLAGHDCLVYTNDPAAHEWQFFRQGQRQSVRVHGSVQSDNGEILVAAALAGLGVVLMPRFLCQRELDTGQLVELLPDWKPPGLTVHAVYADRRWVPPRVRALIDFLLARFSGP